MQAAIDSLAPSYRGQDGLEEAPHFVHQGWGFMSQDKPTPWWASTGCASTPFMGCTGLIALVLAILIGCSAIVGNKKSPDGDPVEFYVVCQSWVEQQLRSPSTADFPASSSQGISNVGKEWKVASYVDAQNGFGAIVRTRFNCSATYVGEGVYRGSARLLD